MAQVRERVGAAEDDLLMLAGWAGEPKGQRPEETVYQACGQLRLHAAQKYNDRHKLLDPKNFEFLWVVDFPMFEWDEEENRWNAAHHPFTSVHDEDIEKLTTDPARCRAKSYDLVLNGVELGSGSIRIHRRDVQSKVFARAGLHDGRSAPPLRLPAGRAGIRRAAARRHRAGFGPAGDDSGGRDFDPRRDSLPQDRQRHGPDVRSAGGGAGAAVARDWDRDTKVKRRYDRAGKTPTNAMQKFNVRYGHKLLCGPLPPVEANGVRRHRHIRTRRRIERLSALQRAAPRVSPWAGQAVRGGSHRRVVMRG